MPRRVCVICDGATLARTGVGSHTLTLVRALGRMGIATLLLTSGETGPVDVDVETIDADERDIDGFRRLLPRHLARLDVDVVHFNNVDTVATVRPDSRRPAWTATVHTHRFLSAALSPVLLSTSDRLDALVSVTEDYVRDLEGAVRRLVHIPNGVDLARFRFRQRWSFDRSRRLRALLPARIVSAKRPAFAAEAVRSLACEMERDVVLVVAGDRASPQANALVAAGEGVRSSVEFAGWRAYADMPELYAGADLVLAPSLVETYGMTVAESLAVGVPVFVPAGTAAGAVVEQAGVAGHLTCQADDPAAWSGRIRRVLEQPATYRCVARTGRRWAEAAASADEMALRYVTLWQDLLA